jgi:hypothetical protein
LTNWTEVAAIAEFVAAAVLTVSAGALVASAVATKHLTEKTDALSGHTKTLADETQKLGQHAQLDREMRYRPYVVANLENFMGMTGQVTRPMWAAVLHNAGEGPALDCSVAFVGDRGEFGSVRGFALDPHEHWRSPDLLTVEVTHPEGIFSPPPGTSEPALAKPLVVVCTDVLGIRWRFLDGLPPEPWRPTSDEPAPPWTRW